MFRVVFDEVGADDGSSDGVQMVECFADGHASGLTMRNAGSEGGVEDIHIERDVYRAGEFEFVERGQVAHFDDFHSEAPALLALVAIHGANAKLDEAFGTPFFHHAGEGAGVGEAVAIEFVIEVGMGVEVYDGEIGDAFAEGAENRIGDGVIAAE